MALQLPAEDQSTKEQVEAELKYHQDARFEVDSTGTRGAVAGNRE